MLDGDTYGWFETCLQCAWENDLEVFVEPKGEPQKTENFTTSVVPLNDQSELFMQDIKTDKHKGIRRLFNFIQVKMHITSKV